jgi:flagellar biosynthesis protein FlhA
MELTKNSTSLTGSFSEILKSGILPLGIIVLVAMMVLPLPVFLLDVFFVSNILISLVILMVAMHTFRPLDFSSFPNLLLIATVLRLALNVASTRVVLSQGHTGNDAAGQIIEAFGNFIVAGNYAVGIFVFIILVIINLVVITKGAGRVSEVSARFTLDAMPGKQMAIDADLNAGVLTAYTLIIKLLCRIGIVLYKCASNFLYMVRFYESIFLIMEFCIYIYIYLTIKIR